MIKGICKTTLIPMRKEPSETSEMVSQVLFGDTYTVIDEVKNWYKIKLDFDGYLGWIDAKLINVIDESMFLNIINSKNYVTDKLITTATIKGEAGIFYLLAGSTLYNLQGNNFTLAENSFQLTFPISSTTFTQSETIIFSALQFINIPYLWGGRSSFGLDCSGLVQTACKIAGFKIARDASLQALDGEPINSIDDAKPSDLLFFENENGKIVHVGILLSPGKIIHSSGYVRIDSVDKDGIFNQDRKEYTHKLKFIKRLI
jgi:gamma-D-glutamyl-L-lysine dipeptidyl-peptidase